MADSVTAPSNPMDVAQPVSVAPVPGAVAPVVMSQADRLTELERQVRDLRTLLLALMNKVG